MVADLLREFGTTESVGVERAHLPALYVEALKKQVPSASLSDAGEVFESVRVIKTKGELELIAYAARATDKAIQTGFALARPGDTEQHLAATIQGAAVRLGADGLDHADVHAGAHATVVHAWPMALELTSGDVIHVDFGAVFGGYRTDIARNATVHSATPKQLEFYRPLWVARERMLEAITPGITAGELFSTGQSAIESEGLKYPWGTLGHSIGLAIHEGFEIVRESDRVLEEDMVLNIEPSHIEPGHARYHLEDAVCVTASGARLLSDFSRGDELAVIH
jgi:Xaa-Pro aminopeptidase